MRFSLIVVILLCSELVNSQNFVLQQINMLGIEKTDSALVYSQLDLKIGEPCSKESILRNEQYLRDLNLFFSVECSLDTLENRGIVVNFHLKEHVYWYPYFNLGIFQDQVNLQLGFGNLNFRGRGGKIKAIYQYYGRHSLTLFMQQYRHIGKKIGHEFILSKRSTIEPIYFTEQKAYFNFDNYQIGATGFYWFNRYLWVSFGNSLFYEIYTNREKSTFVADNKTWNEGDKFQFLKNQVRLGAQYNHVEPYFELRNGLKANITYENVHTFGTPEASFNKAVAEIRYFKHIANRLQFSGRLGYGISTNTPSPFAPFVIDSYVNVRGAGNRIARGTAELFFGIEQTTTFWRNEYFFLGANIYLDGSILREPQQMFTVDLNNDYTSIYSGLGLKLQMNKWYNTVFRLDYGWNLNQITRQDLTFGVGHFF